MSECEISVELLDAPVSNPDLATIAVKLCRWEELAPQLRLTLQQEITIRQNHVGDYDGQKLGALRRWKMNEGAAATYRAFIAAARAASNMELVDSVKYTLRMREKPTGIATPTTQAEKSVGLGTCTLCWHNLSVIYHSNSAWSCSALF